MVILSKTNDPMSLARARRPNFVSSLPAREMIDTLFARLVFRRADGAGFNGEFAFFQHAIGNYSASDRSRKQLRSCFVAWT